MLREDGVKVVYNSVNTTYVNIDLSFLWTINVYFYMIYYNFCYTREQTHESHNGDVQ
jgi:hypothetical protein